LPGWLVGWDVFCFIGHRRFARHWSVPPIRAELRDGYDIALSVGAIARYIRRYQAMVAARQQDRQRLIDAYRGIDSLVLTIDGLQPEKGHEALYTVREVNAKRVWFAEALLSSSTAEVCRLLGRAREMADYLGKPVRLWMSDKQGAFVKGIASVFPGVPHRYCVNHFLRDLAKPMLKADSHAKVQLRKKVRGPRHRKGGTGAAAQGASGHGKRRYGRASSGREAKGGAEGCPGGATGASGRRGGSGGARAGSQGLSRAGGAGLLRRGARDTER
jgi:hypothetical protein